MLFRKKERRGRRDSVSLAQPELGNLEMEKGFQAVHEGSSASKIIERLVEAYLKTKKG